MNSNNTIPSVSKALLLLEHLGKSDAGATQQELAKELEITPSTCYRILQTLQKRDWVRRQTGNAFTVSGGILTAAMKLVDRVARFEAAQPILERLSTQSGLSSKLSIRQGDDQVTVLRAESPRPMSVSGKVGARFPVAEGSVGAALLCKQTEEEIIALASDAKVEINEKSDPKLIVDMVKQVDRDGYCLNPGKSRWPTSAMSVPVFDESEQVIAAITCLGFADDFENESELAGMLQAAANECSRLA